MYSQIKLVLTSSDQLHVNEVGLMIAPSIISKAWSVPAAAQLRLCVLQVQISTYPFSSLELFYTLKFNQALHTKLVCVRAHCKLYVQCVL